MMVMMMSYAYTKLQLKFSVISFNTSLLYGDNLKASNININIIQDIFLKLFVPVLPGRSLHSVAD